MLILEIPLHAVDGRADAAEMVRLEVGDLLPDEFLDLTNCRRHAVRHLVDGLLGVFDALLKYRNTVRHFRPAPFSRGRHVCLTLSLVNHIQPSRILCSGWLGRPVRLTGPGARLVSGCLMPST